MKYVVAGFITPTSSSFEQEMYAINNEDMQMIGGLLRKIHDDIFGGMTDCRIEFVCSLCMDNDGFPMPYVKLEYVPTEKLKMKKLVGAILQETELDVKRPVLEEIHTNQKRLAKYLANKKGEVS
ncbi:MAG: hypothetical protein HGA36_04310 [Candidatus Moranbacteria bacterium]|nr:hypothetical protein [Candidatus Moranbacteria bacterium]